MTRIKIVRVARVAALAIFGVLTVTLSLGGIAHAQDQGGAEQAAPRQAAPKQAAAPKSGGGGDRVARIEEQLVDLQVAIGSLQSMVRNSGAASAPQPAAAPAPSYGGGGGAADDGRVMVLETQIQALTSQLEQVTAQMAALEQRLGGGSGGGSGGLAAPMPRGGNDAPAQYLPNAYEAPRPADVQQQAAAQGSGGQAGAVQDFDHQASFGDVGGNAPRQLSQAGAAADPIGGLIGGNAIGSNSAPGAGSAEAAQAPRDLAALAPDLAGGAGADPSGASPKEIYDSAYRQLMAREYDSAESSFRLFVSSFPKDPLAGEAQYWLGETHYVRGQHKQAADAFLAAYRGYSASRKAPDSLLKLALSLTQLKQKDAACSALSQFGEKYPAAAKHLQERANSERRRAGC